MLSDACVYVVVNEKKFKVERVFAYESDARSFLTVNDGCKIIKQKLWYSYDDVGEENNFFRKRDLDGDDSYEYDSVLDERDNFSLKDF